MLGRRVRVTVGQIRLSLFALFAFRPWQVWLSLPVLVNLSLHLPRYLNTSLDAAYRLLGHTFHVQTLLAPIVTAMNR